MKRLSRRPESSQLGEITPGTLSLSFFGDPPSVAIERDAAVPDDLWKTVERNLAPGHIRVVNQRLLVPVESLLQKRNWLARTLVMYDCDAIFDPSVLKALDQEIAESQEVTRALGLPPDKLYRLQDSIFSSGNRFQHRYLRFFQKRDLAQIVSLSNAANFSVPGAGKTAVAYGCYEVERLRGRVQRLLVVAPLSAFDSWIGEAQRWMDPSLEVTWLENCIPRDSEVLLVNYQKLSTRYDEIASWVYSKPCHVILDEAHRIKRGRNGEWGAACLNLSYLASRRDILTGTPAPQHPSDFVALLDFLWPRQAKRILPSAALQPNPTRDTMVDISRRLRPLFVRTKKGELGLRAPTLRVEYVNMKPLQTTIYAAVRKRMQQQIAMTLQQRSQLSHLTDVVMYLIEAATNPALLAAALGGTPSPTSWPPAPVPPDTSIVDQILNYSQHETPRKFEKLATKISKNAAANRKTLVWSNFVSNLEELATRVLAPYHPALIYGAIPSSPHETDFVTRQTELARFRDDADCLVLLANPAAMSEGVSLHKECHDAIYLDRTFNAGQYLQSVDRIHRLGLRRNTETRITFLVTRGTIDEVIDQRVRLKAERLSQMLSDPNLTVMALPEAEDYGEWVETNDLDSLFSHLGSTH